MLSAFRTNLPGVLTFDGIIHGMVSKIVFIIFPVAVGLLSFSIKHEPKWKHLYIHTVTTVIFSILIISVYLIANSRNWFGLFERLMVADIVIWVEVTAFHVFLLSLKLERQASS